MKSLTLTANQKPDRLKMAEYQMMMRAEGYGRIVVKVEGQEDTIIEVEQTDADGRVLLRD